MKYFGMFSILLFLFTAQVMSRFCYNKEKEPKVTWHGSPTENH